MNSDPIRLTVSSEIATPAHALFELRENPFNISSLGPLVPVHVLAAVKPLEKGDVYNVSFKLLWKSVTMELLIESVGPDRSVVDVQRRGTFKHWRHEQRTEALGEMRSRLTDTVYFRLFGGPVGRIADAVLTRTFLWLEFRRQHRQIRRLTSRH